MLFANNQIFNGRPVDYPVIKILITLFLPKTKTKIQSRWKHISTMGQTKRNSWHYDVTVCAESVYEVNSNVATATKATHGGFLADNRLAVNRKIERAYLEGNLGRHRINHKLF